MLMPDDMLLILLNILKGLCCSKHDKQNTMEGVRRRKAALPNREAP
jgi:hypothetical protein